MDRDYQIMKDGYLYAKVKFRYDRGINGKAFITTFSSYDNDDEEGTKSVYESGNYDEYIFHDRALKTIEEIKAHDRSYAQKSPYLSRDLTGKIEFIYEPIHYRYVIGDERHNIGIVDIQADFNANKKELQFTSARKVREDQSLSSDSTETNGDLIRRLAEQPWLDFVHFPIREVEGWYI
jgi:hypothetical protein